MPLHDANPSIWRYDGKSVQGRDALPPIICGRDSPYVDVLDAHESWQKASGAYAYMLFATPDQEGSKKPLLPAYRSADDYIHNLCDLGYTSNHQPREEDNPSQMSMKLQFHALQSEDPATIFLVRRASKLGLNGASTLRRYFSSFGPVKNVYTTVSNQARGKGRPRLSHLAFVVMETSEAVSTVLENSEHVCEGHEITVKAFQSKTGCSDFTQASAAKWTTCENQETKSNAPKTLREHLLAFPMVPSWFPSDDCEVQQIIQVPLSA